MKMSILVVALMLGMTALALNGLEARNSVAVNHTATTVSAARYLADGEPPPPPPPPHWLVILRGLIGA